MFTKETKYLFLITVIFIAACIETDIYLPAFTDMMKYFSISEDQIQGLLTWNFIGICVSSPFYGPISDSIGRKKPLLAALGMFLLGSIITLFASNFELMLVGRILQGLGSGGCFTLGTAIIFDAFPENKAMIALNKLNSIVPIIMAGAPMLGGYLNVEFGFRSNFLAIAICVLISSVVCMVWFDETLSPDKRKPLEFKKMLNDFKKVSLSIPFLQTITIVSLLFAGYLVFLSGISVLFVIEYGVSKETLPLYQISLLGAWVSASLIYKKAIEAFGPIQIKRAGIVITALGGLTLILAGWLAPYSSVLLTLPMVLYSFGVNWVQNAYFPEGMELFPDLKGVTSSLLTSARLLITSAVVGVVSALYDATIYPILYGLILIMMVIFGTIFLFERRKANTLRVNFSEGP